jgi:hypothetical protein
MIDAKVSRTCDPLKSAIFFTVAGLAVAVLVTGAVILVAPRPAQAKSEFTAQTGLPCGQCHVNPAGGNLTSFGKAFKANGLKVPKEKK